jgi:flagellar assembly factor FliW
MPEIQTKYFSSTEYQPDAVFHFPAGLPGFEEEHSFVFLERPDTDPLLFMQSTSNPDLCFVLLPVLAVDPKYRLGFTPEDRAVLRLAEERDPEIGMDILCGAVVCAGDESRPTPTANLLAPIVVNLRQRIGLQMIQTQSGYSHQHPLFPREELVPCS